VAKELNGNGQVSYSNVVCLPHIPMVYIPNAFSPNNDFINDTFKISAIGITETKISIYNRWGEKVYENNTGEAINWDGKFKSAFVPADIYTYTLQMRTAERKNLYKTGIINLIR
jgi:gliding motility-associated-like protein